MNVVFKPVLLSFFSLTIIACSFIPKIDEESLPKGARVGVVSLMYDYMDYLNFSGIPIYSYQDDSYFVSDWKINEFVQSTTAKHLEGRFNIIDIKYNTVKLKKGFDNTNPYTGLPIYYIHSVEKEFTKLVKAYNLDAIIVAVQNYTKPNPFYQPYAYGLVYKKFFRQKLSSFAAISLRIYDGQSLRVLSLSENVESYIKVEGLPVYSSYDDYSNNEKKILKSWVEKAFESAILSAISDMKLNSN